MITRRTFLVGSGLTALAATRVFGANDTIRLGILGCGDRAKQLLDAADKTGLAYQIVAVSDVYTPHSTRSRCDRTGWRARMWIIGRCWRGMLMQ